MESGSLLGVIDLGTTREQLATLLGQSDTYVQLGAIAMALLVAWLVALLVQKRLELMAESVSYRHTFSATLRAISNLTSPLLAILSLAIVKVLVIRTFSHAELMDHASTLMLAWLAFRLLGLIIHQQAVARFVGAIIFILAILSITSLLGPMANYLDSFDFNLGSLRLSLLSVLKGLSLLAVLVWLAGVLSRGVDNALYRNSNLSFSSRRLVSMLFSIFIYLIAILIAMNVVGIDMTALTVFGGALGVGIGFGLQKVTSNFISGIILLFEKSLRVGDQVDIGGQVGWVRQMAVRYTLIEMVDGKEVMIPNEDLIASRVTNLTYSNKRGRLDITINIAFDSNVEQAITDVLEAASSHPRCMNDPKPACFLQQFSDNGMTLFAIFWLEDVTESPALVKSEVMIEIVKRFRSNGITFAIPQRATFVHNV